MSAQVRLADPFFPESVHVMAGEVAHVLAAIRAPAINLAIWQRRLAPTLQIEVNRLLASPSGDVRLTVAVAGIAKALALAMHNAGWPTSPALVADVADLAALAAPLMSSPVLDLRLDVITGDACRKFHADYVPLRLITSYAGPGSQFLSNDDAAALAGGVAVEQLDVRQLLAGEVALFKGRLLTDTPIIHRSPPIAGTGTRRLVLVINPAPAAFG